MHSNIITKMISKLMKRKSKNVTFICQITDNSLKVIKCLLGSKSKTDFMTASVEALPPNIEEKELSQRLIQTFKKLEYKNNPVIVSLSRSKVTCRYLKVPSQDLKEIERIVSLQASRYLPYPANELITAYQIISIDKEGYSHINLVIAHKDIIEYYLRVLKELKPERITIVLSSYGITNLYAYIKPDESEAVMILDIDSSQLELVVASNKKVLFSRYFKINTTLTGWEGSFIDEINKSKDAYLKEVAAQTPNKLIIIGDEKTHQEFIRILNKQTDLPIEILSYENINLSKELLNEILISNESFASLIGLGLKEIEENLNLVTADTKEASRRLIKRKEQLQLVSLILSIILIFGLGIAKNLDNKASYLKQLKVELNKIAQEGKALEETQKRLEFIENRLQKKPTSLEVLYELHQFIPPQIYLVNFSYEEANQVILRGQTSELNSVFTFVSQLEKSPIFRNFNVKVRYATKKMTATGEVIDFEIICLREK